MSGKVVAGACERVVNHLKGLPMSATLFSNDHTPTIDDSDDCSDYTAATGMGLDPIIMTDWEDVVLDEGRADVEHALTWNPGSDAEITVYGIFVRDYMSGDLIGAVRFPTPVTLEEGVPFTYNLKLFAKDPTAE